MQEGEHTQTSKSPHIALLYLRFKRLLHRGYRILAQSEAGIDIAIKQAWSSYAPGAVGWVQVSTVADHWITTTTAADAAGSAKRVHYNLLSGELLVNGSPIDQPPTNYRVQPLFKTLFGEAISEVMKSKLV